MSIDDRRRASDRLNDLHRRYADEDYEQTQADYRELLKLPAFRRVLVGIIKRARVFGSISFDKVETNDVMKQIGWRELGVDIYMTANNADGELVLKAIQERNEVERDRKRTFEVEMKGNGK